jgi:hypothetical protein
MNTTAGMVIVGALDSYKGSLSHNLRPRLLERTCKL